MKPYFYFAGPDVFFKKRVDSTSTYISLLSDILGFNYYFPGDLDASSKEDIFGVNVRNLTKADAVIANVIDFRSPQMDVGTAWEIGCAYACNIPIFAYADPIGFMTVCEKMPENEEYYTEDFGLYQNLMIIESVFAKTVFDDIDVATRVAIDSIKMGQR